MRRRERNPRWQEYPIWDMDRDGFALSMLGLVPTFANWEKVINDEDLNRQYYDAKKLWDHEVGYAVALGIVGVKHAENRGWHEGPSLSEQVKHLPERLFHVTTNVPAVVEHGLWTRDELKMREGGYGLGGGPSGTISFTTDPQIAEEILSALLEFRAFLAGELSADDLLYRAQRGEGSDTPWYRDVERYFTNNGKRQNWGDAQPALDGMVHEWSTLQMYPLDRPATEEEILSARNTLFNAWALYREEHGGPLNPLFFSVDLKSLSRLDPSRFGILEFMPAPGAFGYQVSALGEWRTWTGEAVQLVGVVEPAWKGS